MMKRYQRFFKFSFVLYILVLFYTNAFAGYSQIDIRILPESIVYGKSYTLGDIAELDGFDVDKIQKIAKVKLGLSPLPGRSLLISKRKLQANINKILKSNEYKISMSAKSMVSRASIKIKAKQLKDIIIKDVKEKFKKYDDVKIYIQTKLKDQYVPKGIASYQLKRIGKRTLVGGYSSWYLILESDQKEVKKLMVRLKVDVIDNVLVAKDKIRRGDKIEEDDLKTIRKNISKEKSGYESKSNFVVGQQARRDILENESVKTNLVEMPILIHKGSPVKVIYKTEKIYLTNIAIALKSGKRGDTIPVKTIKNKTTIFVTILDEKNVEVTL